MSSYGDPRGPPASISTSPDRLHAPDTESEIPTPTNSDLQFSGRDYHASQPQAPEGSWDTNLSPSIGGTWESNEQVINYPPMTGNMDRNAGWWTGPPSGLLQQNFTHFSSGFGPIAINSSSSFGGE
ncbi:hypothetical protein H0H81_007137, partial [Sphagnurus paluster]